VRALPRLAIIAAILVAAAGVARGDRAASRGVFTEAGLGATGFLGDAQGYSQIGPTLSLRAGYDLASWLSVGVQLAGSSHEATVPPPPEGEWFQLYRGAGDARLGFRAGGLAFFAEGGVGVAHISSNILEKVMVTDPGERSSIAFDAGGGLEYQIDNRHYAFGLAGDWLLIPGFAALTGIEGRVYLRYTY